MLKPLQERNKTQAMHAEILKVAGLSAESNNIDALFEQQIITRLIDLETGEYVEDVEPRRFDQRAAARDPQQSISVPPDRDIASIKSRANYAPVYLVGDGDSPELIILPVHGYGLWSTLYGLLALDSDGNTIKGITFYEQAETAGLGAEITNPRWQAQWVGKQVFDASGDVQFQLVKGGVDSASAAAQYEVDALSGATLTSNGVTNLMRYWMSDQGFGPYLAKLQ
jgi:Na+-transporting NADH:ubiquinone oxidoreductase subunit C